MSVEAFIADSAIGSIRVRARDLGPLGEALMSAGASIELFDDGPAMRIHGLTAEQIREEAARAGAAVFDIYEEHGSLEEAFMRRTEDALQYRGADERKVVV